ncbi:hypothetical protein LguiA_010151 [Lonicera macranthoides]
MASLHFLSARPTTTRYSSISMIKQQSEQRRLIVLLVRAGFKIDMNNRRKPSWPAAATVVTNGPRPASTTTATRNGLLITAAAAAVLVLSWVMGANAVEETLSNIPQTLSSRECLSGGQEECEKKVRPRIQKPKSRKAESCTIKCVTTCIRGGDGSPGEGPLNVRRPLVVFKQGFRSRQYCLMECSDICNLIRDGDDGP